MATAPKKKRNGWIRPITFGGLTAEENLKLEQSEKTCKTCGAKALYRVGRDGYCKDHKPKKG